MRKIRLRPDPRVPLSAVSLLVAACGGAQESPSRPTNPWGNDVTVIEPDGSAKDYPAPGGDECISSEGAVCIPVSERCGPGAPADVVLDRQGNVADIVCYPTSGTLTPEEIEAHQGNVAQNQNGSVVVLDGVADGIDLEGNLSIDANKVVIYGYGPDVSVMSGDLVIDGNNTIVRGIRVLGSLEVPKNDSVLVFCVIEGDVLIIGNNTRLSGCDVFGSVRIEGNNTVLSGNRIQGTVEVIGDNTRCENNSSFQDLDGDRLVEESELGFALTCG